MAVCTIASSKGGAGKTTIARVVAVSYARHYRVGCLDADRNPAFFRWLTQHDVPNVTAVKETDDKKIIDIIADLHEKNDLVVVDTAGAETEASLLAMSTADLVIIPSQLSQDDLIETIKTVNWAETAASKTPHKVNIRVLLTRVKTGTRITDHVFQVMKDNQLPALPTFIRDLVAFGEMSHMGGLPASEQAKADVETLMKAMGEVLEPIFAEEKAAKISGDLKALGVTHG